MISAFNYVGLRSSVARHLTSPAPMLRQFEVENEKQVTWERAAHMSGGRGLKPSPPSELWRKIIMKAMVDTLMRASETESEKQAP